MSHDPNNKDCRANNPELVKNSNVVAGCADAILCSCPYSTEPYGAFQVGDYVMVVNVPDPWEGSGEEDSDREAFVGHIGVVNEINYDYRDLAADKPDCGYFDHCHIRFPGIDRCYPAEVLEDHETLRCVYGERNIEMSALRLVSRPAKPLTANVFLEGGE